MTNYRTANEQTQLDAMLDRLTAAEELRRQAQKRVDDAVAMLRAEDAAGACLGSWGAIGEALGITKQAARQRYGRRGLD